MKKLFILLLSPLFHFLQSCISPLGECIDEKVSDSYYTSKSSDDEVIYSPMGNWFELGKTKFKADRKTFTPLARNIGKDQQLIYYCHQPQPQVDYSSFQINNDVIKDKQHVYYEPTDYTYNLLIVEGADPSTFHYPPMGKLPYDHRWTKDKTHYFFYYLKTAVDYNSFYAVAADIYADKNFVYIPEEGKLSVKDTVTGKINLIHDNYAVMDNTLFISHTYNGFSKIDFKKITNVKPVDEYCIIVNDVVIVNGKKFPYADLDIATFQTYPEWRYMYSKDKHNVYFEGEIISGADVATFEVLEQLHAKDAKHAYYKKGMLKGVDPKTFHIDSKTGFIMNGKIRYVNGEPFDGR